MAKKTVKVKVDKGTQVNDPETGKSYMGGQVYDVTPEVGKYLCGCKSIHPYTEPTKPTNNTATAPKIAG